MYMERYTKNAKLIIYGVVKRRKKIMISISEQNQNQNQTFNKKGHQRASVGTCRKRKTKGRKKAKDFEKVKQETKKK